MDDARQTLVSLAVPDSGQTSGGACCASYQSESAN